MIRHKKLSAIIVSFIILFCFIKMQYSTITPLTNTSDVDAAFSFSLENGFYQDDIQIGLQLLPSYSRQLQIRYTLDGSTPNASSPLYTKPLFYPAEDEIKAITVRAIVCDQDQNVVGGAPILPLFPQSPCQNAVRQRTSFLYL